MISKDSYTNKYNSETINSETSADCKTQVKRPIITIMPLNALYNLLRVPELELTIHAGLIDVMLLNFYVVNYL